MMHWMSSRKGFCAFFASIIVAFAVLLSVPRHSTLASTNSMASTITPIPVVAAASAPNTALGMTNSPTQSYPAPILVSPAPGATIVGEAKTDFSWQWDGDLKEGERFDVRIWRPDKLPHTFFIGRECNVLLDTPPDGFGEYLWQVAVVRIDRNGQRDLSTSEVRRFVWIANEAEVTCISLNLRSGPGLNYDPPIYTLNRGEILDIIGRIASNKWIQVIPASFPETQGWVSAWPEYVDINVDINTIPMVEPSLPPGIPVPTPDAAVAPEAVVYKPGGIATLRSGPEVDYNLVRTLPNGTALQVLRRVHNKDSWIKVAVNPDSPERVEGYVNIASGLIKVDVDLNSITPIHEFGPVLNQPENWVAPSIGDTLWFTWERFELKPNQYYSLRVVPDVGPGSIPCIHIQVHNPEGPDRDPGEFLKLDCPRGAYYWSVFIATKLPEGSEDEWLEDSESNHNHYLGIGMPHPNIPPDYEPEGELPPDI